MRVALAFLAACGTSAPQTEPDARVPTGDGVVVPPDGSNGVVTLATPVKKQIFLEMVNSAEQSQLDWTTAYPYCEDIGDGRGYTTGIVGFTTDSAGATPDDGPGVLGVVKTYNKAPLLKYLSALQMTADSGSGSHAVIDAVGNFCNDWKTAAADVAFEQAQQQDFNITAFDPARELAIADGLGVLGQAMYADDSILDGYGGKPSLSADVTAAKAKAKTPAQGGDEQAYLTAFAAAYRASIDADSGHANDGSTDRVDTMWGPLVTAGNLGLDTPLHWKMYGDPFAIETDPTPDPSL